MDKQAMDENEGTGGPSALSAGLGAKRDLNICPGCGGPADNGHDRCYPPNPYYCKRCNDPDKVAADAARYRWLCNRRESGGGFWVAHGRFATGISQWNGDALDTAIDEAMANPN